LHFEVDAHCADEGRGEGIVSVAEQERGFAHAAVADDQQLEHPTNFSTWELSPPLRIWHAPLS
ncbi:hypothetical protein INR49_032220, partial [Caranx melampygus]